MPESLDKRRLTYEHPKCRECGKQLDADGYCSSGHVFHGDKPGSAPEINNKGSGEPDKPIEQQSESEKESQPDAFYARLKDLFYLAAPDGVRVLRLLRTNLTDSERLLLKSNGYTVVEIKEMDELLSDRIGDLILGAQRIKEGRNEGKGMMGLDLPSKLSLVVPPDLIRQAVMEHESFGDIWRRHAMYGMTIDETNL